MGWFRWVEGVCGVLAAVAGETIVVFQAVGPVYQSQTCTGVSPGVTPTCVSSTATLIQVEGAGILALLGLLTALLLGIGAGAVWHVRMRRGGARGLLWGCTIILAAFAVLSLPSIGLFLLPSVLLALIASVASLTVRTPVTV